MTQNKDCLNVVLVGVIAAALLSAAAVALLAPAPNSRPIMVADKRAIKFEASGGPFARAGEWVTDPTTGARVCRLTRDLYRGMVMTLGTCSDWVNGLPNENEGMSWLRYPIINIEGTWRP